MAILHHFEDFDYFVIQGKFTKMPRVSRGVFGPT